MTWLGELVRRPAVAEFTLPPAELAAPVAAAGVGPTSPITRAITDAQTTNRSVALSIPAVRKARHVIAGTISTFTLAGWTDDGTTKLASNDQRCAWLSQPERLSTLQSTLFRTVDDALWYDRAVWRIVDRNLSGLPVKFEFVAQSRVDTISDPRDPSMVTTWIIDGAPTSARNLVIFDFGGMGGLRRYGADILALYLDLQAAAGRYARAPHPQAILKNHGADLTPEAVQALLDQWESARATRSVGYLNDVVDYDTFGWDAAQLQLTEGREYAALEVARMFGLPARAVDASSGDSMTYANVAESRRDILEALRPWMTVIDQTLSLDDRTTQIRGLYLPLGVTARFDIDAYTRDAPADRMTTWATALASGVLTLDEVRTAEPLATTTAAAAAPQGVPA